jgi:hypothetical protein
MQWLKDGRPDNALGMADPSRLLPADRSLA